MLARDLEQEQDIEQLRQIAVAMHAQIEQLVAALARKCKELESFKGSKDELQQTLALIEALKKNKQTIDKAVAAGTTSRKPRTQSGPTDQPQLPLIDKPCAFDDGDPDMICDACGGDPGTLYSTYNIVPANCAARFRMGSTDKTATLGGALDEVAIFNRKLTKAELEGLYWSGIGVP